MKRFSMLIPICMLLFLKGCVVNTGFNAESETDLGSHHVTVRPGNTLTSSSEMSQGEDITYEFTCGEVKIKIENELLTVNNQIYGELKPGQSIEIDHGKVIVDGEERKSLGKVTSEENEDDGEQESETELGSHLVTVKPGSTLTSSSEFTFGNSTTYKYTCGTVNIQIKNEMLTVNDKSYGELKPGEPVEIDHGKVFISDQARAPAPAAADGVDK